MTEKLAIENLSEKNFDEFVKLMKLFADFEKLTPPDDDARKRLKRDGIGKNTKYEAYLFKINDKYVAYAIFLMAYGSFKGMPTLFLEDVFVLKEYRKKGIGQQILNFVVKKAKDRNCDRIDLYVLDWNENAIKFYEKNKFKLMNWKIYRMENKQII